MRRHAAPRAGAGLRLGRLPGPRHPRRHWAARFLFTSEQLNQPVERFSGGERARVLIAKLMLEPADVLLLDEPTNDLDIATLEILEESLLEFTGALVLVTHDRYMLDRVSTIVLGLDGMGKAETFADYSQWEQWQEEGSRFEVQGFEGTRGLQGVREKSGGKRSSRIWKRASTRPSRTGWRPPRSA